MADDRNIYCSICAKSYYEVKKMIAGPSVFVCNECVGLCVDIIIEDDSAISQNFLDRDIGETAKRLLTQVDMDAITREIEFPPEYRHAGVTILASFSDLVREKYKDENVKISIQQENNKVILVIKSGSGELKERIVETLQSYGMVLSGAQPVESLSDDPYKVAEIKQQLRIAQVQLENQKELLEMERSHSTQLVKANKHVEKNYKNMLKLVSESLSSAEERNLFLKTLLETSLETQSELANDAIKTLIQLAESKPESVPQAEVKKQLNTIQENDPTAFSRIAMFGESSVAGAAGNALYSWILPIINTLPK